MPNCKKSTKLVTSDDLITNFNQVNYIQVTSNHHEQRLDNFLFTRLRGMPKSHVYKLIRCNEVRVNKKRAKAQQKLKTGDVVRLAPMRLPSQTDKLTDEQVTISDAFAQNLLARVVYEDDGLLVLNKPSGMAVHGGSGVSVGVIEAMRYATHKNYLELVHRIDKDTSGLLMIAKKRRVLKQLQDDLREKRIQKSYLALVAGTVALDEQLIDTPLLRYILANGERRVRVDNMGKPSQTWVTVLKRLTLANGQAATLIEAQPRTGRTHQIRVHLAYIGHALLGDDKYHVQDASGARRLCLHARQLQIPDYPTITVDMPVDMQQLM